MDEFNQTFRNIHILRLRRYCVTRKVLLVVEFEAENCYQSEVGGRCRPFPIGGVADFKIKTLSSRPIRFLLLLLSLSSLSFLPSSLCVGSPPHTADHDERIARKSGVISTPKAFIVPRPFLSSLQSKSTTLETRAT